MSTNTIVPYAISGVLLLIGAGCAHGVVHWFLKARAMSRWPTVPGVVTSTWDSLDDGKILYDYQVGAKRYVGRRVFWFVGKSTADRTPQELTETYPPGSDVTVYYDPKSPKTSILEPWNRQNMWLALVFAVVFTAFGTAVLLAGLYNT